MNDLNVKILTLEPMRVASAYGFGVNPEEQAWQKMVAWAKPKGLLEDITAHPLFGFNNPNPSAGVPGYGYEFWIRVGPEAEPEGDVRIVEFMGGTYACARCEVQGDPGAKIPATWKSLIEWCKMNRYRFACHQAVERFLSSPDDIGNLAIEICCPIIPPEGH